MMYTFSLMYLYMYSIISKDQVITDCCYHQCCTTALTACITPNTVIGNCLTGNCVSFPIPREGNEVRILHDEM